MSNNNLSAVNLVQRLRGKYTLKINDGCGPLDGNDSFTREFEVPAINKLAADVIVRLAAHVYRCQAASSELHDLAAQVLDTGSLAQGFSEFD